MKNIFYFVLFAVLLASSCKKATYLTAHPESVSLSYTACSDSIILRSDVHDFNIVSYPDWATVSLKDSVLLVSAADNKSPNRKSGNVIVKDGDLMLSINVLQYPKATYIKCDEKIVHINKSGAPVDIKIETDGGKAYIDGVENVISSYDNGILTLSNSGNNGKSRKTKAKIVSDEQEIPITIIEEGEICSTCNGGGRVTCQYCGGSGHLFFPYRDCNICYGSGRSKCPDCKGNGK